MRSRRLRVWHLVTSWLLYWAALFLVEFWRPLVTYWRVTRTPGAQGSASFEVSGNPFEIALWIFGPPIVLTAIWLFLRRAQPAENEAPP